MNYLFVCTGNTCRSCMAEGYLKKILKEKGINKSVVMSAGIFASNSNKASDNAIKVVEKKGFDLSEHVSKQLTKEMVQVADLVLTMTMGHKNTINMHFPECKSKIYTLKEYVGIKENGYDVIDPYGYSTSAYEKCLNQICVCIDKIIV